MNSRAASYLVLLKLRTKCPTPHLHTHLQTVWSPSQVRSRKQLVFSKYAQGWKTCTIMCHQQFLCYIWYLFANCIRSQSGGNFESEVESRGIKALRRSDMCIFNLIYHLCMFLCD
ncbi:hypothetical protein CDAR_223101 [Caerostris darwini]|uniref:Uncharacterized protein n=1 Tax=Caerostris darwini TaxID=1538125 RepID=A0AAV4SS78_9ARAC|nr:hypothetical protein CDAR_223101 [Caerostris darwini]